MHPLLLERETHTALQSTLLGNGWEHPGRWVPFSQHGLICLGQSPEPHVRALQHDPAWSHSAFTRRDRLSFQAQDVTLGNFQRKGNVGSVCNPLLARNVRGAVITSRADRPCSQQLSDRRQAIPSPYLLVLLSKWCLLSTRYVGLVQRLSNQMLALDTEPDKSFLRRGLPM